MVSNFDKGYPVKLTVTSAPVNFVPSMAKLIFKFLVKQKQRHLIKSAT